MASPVGVWRLVEGKTPRFFGNDEGSRRWLLQLAFGVSPRE